LFGELNTIVTSLLSHFDGTLLMVLLTPRHIFLDGGLPFPGVDSLKFKRPFDISQFY